jgi:hypothetical protein
MGIFNKIKKASEVNLKKTRCPACGVEQPKIRKPKNLRQVLWGGNTCENCGCEMDRFGNKVEKK